jgi:hypothetical protein
MNTSLNRDLDAMEVEMAVRQLGALKAPGPDGFSGAFYHKN